MTDLLAADLAADRTRLLAELRPRIARHARQGQETAVDGFLVSIEEQTGEPSPARTGAVMALIIQGAKRVALGSRTYDYHAGQYLVASIDLPITGHYIEASPERPALGLGLVLQPAAIAELLLESGDRAPFVPGPRAGTPSALGVADADNELLDAALRLLRLLEEPRDRRVLAPLIKREMAWRLLNGPMGQSMRQVALADSSLAQISQAVQWITEHHAEPFRIEELARSCGMSTSTFHRCFQAVTAFSPVQFQKQVRLQQSRLLLLAGASDVATVGFRVGYESASQFSREYRRHFGLPPGRDAARLRESAAAAS